MKAGKDRCYKDIFNLISSQSAFQILTFVSQKQPEEETPCVLKHRYDLYRIRALKDNVLRCGERKNTTKESTEPLFFCFVFFVVSFLSEKNKLLLICVIHQYISDQVGALCYE